MDTFTKHARLGNSLFFVILFSLLAMAFEPIHESAASRSASSIQLSGGFAEKTFARFRAAFHQKMTAIEAMFPACILLTNTGFEPNLTGWTTSGTVSSSTDFYAGAKAAAITGNGAFIQQKPSGITAGRVYTATVYAKIEGSPTSAYLLLRFYNSSGSMLSDHSVKITATTYSTYSLGGTAPANATHIEVTANKNGSGGTLKVDDFCIEETIPGIGQCILAQNAGFENGTTNWNSWNGTLSTSSDEHSGASAGQISGSDMSAYQRFGIKAGETYELTIWAKVSGTPDWAEIFLNWKDANDNVVSDIIQPVTSIVTNYTIFTLKGKAPSNAVYAEIGGYKSGSSSSLFLDDFCFALASPLGGSSFDLSCGCSENLVPNGGYEFSNISSFPYTLDGKPAAAIANGNSSSLYPWSAGISSYYMYYVKDIPNTVNNPEGDYYVWLPNSGDCWVSNTDLSNDLLLEDGQTYTFCFYAASRVLNLDGNGFPSSGTPTQKAGILNIEFTYVSGFKVASSWAVPASESATNLSWTKYEYTFTYNILDPVSNFVFTNSRNSVGMYIDAVSLSKVSCPEERPCSTGGITFDRWGGISGTTVGSLASDADYPNNYDETGVLTTFQGPQNYNNDYGTRVYGYLVPPATGNYTFTVTSGDASMLYLSTGSSSLNKSLIAQVPGFTGVSEYSKYSQQASSSISLTAGQTYYVELIHKAGSTNSDHFQVYWQTPSNSTRTIIPGSALRPICFDEICDNGKDDDFDNLTDCADSDCNSGMSGSYAVTDEACGAGNGSIDLQPTGMDTPFSYRWADMAESAMWTFEDNTNDVSGNGKHDNGVTGYMIYTNDAVQGNSAAYFDGNTYIRYSVDNGFMEVAFSKLTVSMWVKPDNLSGTKTLFDEGGSNTSSGKGLALRLNGSSLEASVRNGTSTLYTAGTHTFPNDGNWHHVAAVFDNGALVLYLDGTAGSTNNTGISSIGSHGNNGGIGSAVSGSVVNSSGSNYKGKMDDVRYFFNTALSAGQIATLNALNGDRTALASGTYSVTISSASGCSVAQSVSVASSGNFTSGGTVSGDENSCAASYDPSLISSTAAPSPGSGTTEYKWQVSTDGGSTWADIASTNSATYDPATISAARHYRRGARLSPCTGWVFSNTISKIFTTNYTSAGAISGDEASCGTYDPALISVTPPTSSGDLNFKIDPPASGSSNGATYSITNQSGEPMFLTVTGASVVQVEVKGGPGSAFYTTPPFSNLTSPINPNNGTPYGISHFKIWISGNIGTPEYIWQRSTDGGTTWADISGETASTHNPTQVSQTTSFRRGVRKLSCGAAWLYSNVVTKTVATNYTDPGTIVGEEESCNSFEPDVISSVVAASGGTGGGTVIYQWQMSTNGGTSWSDIANATAAAYEPTTLTQTTLFRRGARRSTCSDFIYSNSILKMVVANFTSGGVIAGEEASCTAFNPTNITSNSLPSGGMDGSIEYRWQQSTNGGATWADIAGASASTYDPPSISQTTLFRRQGRRLPCAVWINSNTVTKTVKPIPVATLAVAPTTTNGYLCEATTYTFQATDAGVGSTYAWSFGSYATPQNATGAGPHNVSFNVPNGTASTTVPVQLTVTLNSCVGSNTFNYNVRPPFTVNNVSLANPSSCTTPDGSITVTATPPSGSSLEASINGTSWISPPLVFSGLDAGSYNVRVRYSGDECESNLGYYILEEPTNPDPQISYLSSNSECIGQTFTVSGSYSGSSSNTTITWDFGDGASPATVNGTGPHSFSYTTGGVKTIRMTATRNGCTGYQEQTVTSIANFTDGGTIGSDQTLCANGVPSPLTNVASPSGGYGGSTYYAWERRQLLGSVWSSWTTISGATSATYSPSSISVTTQYRRRTLLWPCGNWLYSNVVAKTVSELPVANADTFENACPGFVFVGYVSSNDASLSSPVFSIYTQPSNGYLDMDEDGEFYYQPNSTFCGDDQFVYQVCNSTTGCCATATGYIDLSDSEAPELNNIPAALTIHCDDELPLPPVVDAFENCGTVSLSFDELTTQGADSCSIYSYELTRVWTATDYCGNGSTDHQSIFVNDDTAPDIYRIYTLPNGKKVFGGVMENVTQRWKTISFPSQFSVPPVVLAQVISKNENTAVVTRLRNVSTTQFQLRLQEEENNDGTHIEENVAWIAFEPGVNADDLSFEVKTALAGSANLARTFSQSYASPALVGQIQTFNENNPAALRYQSLTGSGVTLFCEEENSLDPEMSHGFETVGYIAFNGAGELETSQGEVFGETGSVAVDHNFQTIQLNQHYHNPVVVLGGIPKTDVSPATIRVQNVTPTSFQVQVDEWDYLDGSHAAELLHYIVIEGSIPFDKEVQCSDIPAAPIIGVEVVGMDNCDASTPLVITDSEWNFDCVDDTTFTRTFYVRDECGNFTQLTQTFILRDTTPPTFTAPADLTLTCADDREDLNLTGDVTDESDNCADDIEATYADVSSYLEGCAGYVLRVWSLSDFCGNTVTASQRIYISTDNDADADNRPDSFDGDDDNDGIPDDDDTYTLPTGEKVNDSDGDGVPNSLDRDSDNDGISDLIEAGFNDSNGDGTADNWGDVDWDTDFDGIGNESDANDVNPSLLASDNFNPLSTMHDRDGDGIPNYLDRDSDNDGIPDIIEAGGVDTNGDGAVDYPVPGNPNSMPDADGDGFSDLFDPDYDSDFGIDNAGNALLLSSGGVYSSGQPAAFNPDCDGDGVPNFLDRDSDNDGIPDLIEAGGVDANGDGKIDLIEFDDADFNGLADIYITFPLMMTEGGGGGGGGGSGGGRPLDINGDGTPYVGNDADMDGIANQDDPDSDNDGITDIEETGEQWLDTDDDGRLDNINDANEDGFNDTSAGRIGTDPDGSTNDGRPQDVADAGSSAYNTIEPDGAFGSINGEPDIDDDGDSVPNFLDTDSDNDGLPDEIEDENTNGVEDPEETGWLNRDSDGDLIPDGTEDGDLDGSYDTGIETDPFNADSDGDGLSDGFEDANQNGQVDEPLESNPRDPCDPTQGLACVGVVVDIKAKLYGAMIDNGGSELMRDDLRVKNLIPLTEPYTDLPNYQHVGEGGGEMILPSVLAVSGDDAIVDWVFAELRTSADADEVAATRSALLQRDGDVVDLDGVSPLRFSFVPSGPYYVAIRHRNHLGVGTQNPLFLSPTPILVDFVNPATPTYGSNSTVSVENELALWPGDLNGDRKVVYQGPANDPFAMFYDVMTDDGNTGNLANYINGGYSKFDLDLDGSVIYQGPSNDRSKLLFHSVMKAPDNVNLLANFILPEKLP